MYCSHVCILIISFMTVLCYDQKKLRGIAPNVAERYDPALKFFDCLNGGHRIPFLQVNDDYCDCPDGSDEPGTSACEHGTFYCVNADHEARTILSSMVNDGICDCCDGSDEWLSNQCPDNCSSLGEAARAAALDKAELHAKGVIIREKMIESAVVRRRNLEKRLNKLLEAKEIVLDLKDETEILMKEALEAKNKALIDFIENQRIARLGRKAFVGLDSNGNGIIELREIEAVPSFDYNHDGVVSPNEIPWFHNVPERRVSEKVFLEWIWPHLIKIYKSLNHEIIQDDEKEEATPPDRKSYDEKTKRVVEKAAAAVIEFDDTVAAAKNAEREIYDISTKLETDYGPEDEYSLLDDKCFTYDDRDYTYTFCPFHHVSQNPKAGGEEIFMGHWEKWVDEESGPIMIYENGQHCWKGPSRTVKVIPSCGIENFITSVTEPDKCVYEIQFTTPAACIPDRTDHEEL